MNKNQEKFCRDGVVKEKTFYGVIRGNHGMMTTGITERRFSVDQDRRGKIWRAKKIIYSFSDFCRGNRGVEHPTGTVFLFWRPFFSVSVSEGPEENGFSFYGERREMSY